MNKTGSFRRKCEFVARLRLSWLAIVVGGCGIAGGTSVCAQEVMAPGLTPFVESDLSLVSNLFRLPGREQAQQTYGDSALSDAILRVGAGFEYGQAVAHQGVSARVAVYRNDYDRFDFLSHTSGTATGTWQWVAGERWDGHLRFDYERRIQGFTESRSSALDERDIYGLRAMAGYSLSRSWRLRLALAQKEQEHGLAERQQLNRTLSQAIAELRFTSPKRSFVGLRTAWSSADFPNPETLGSVVIDSSYQELDTGLTVDWRPSRMSALRGRVGVTKREYDSFSDRDFSGVTWSGDYTWKPRKRYRVKASFWRDLDAYSDAVTSYVVESGFGLEGEWQATSKTTLRLDAASRQRDYDGDPTVVAGADGPTRSDDVLTYGVHGELAFTPKVTFTLGYEYEERESNLNRWDFDCYTIVLGIKASL